MKIFTAALCVISAGILSGCVDDRSYRTGGYYSASGYDRRYDNGRDYRNDRDFRRDRRVNWRDNGRDRYRNNDNRIIYGVIQR